MRVRIQRYRSTNDRPAEHAEFLADVLEEWAEQWSSELFEILRLLVAQGDRIVVERMPRRGGENNG